MINKNIIVLSVLTLLIQTSFGQEINYDSLITAIDKKVTLIEDSSRVGGHGDGMLYFDTIIGENCIHSMSDYNYNDSTYLLHWQWKCDTYFFNRQWYYYANKPIFCLEFGYVDTVKYVYYYYIKDYSIFSTSHTKNLPESFFEKKKIEVRKRLAQFEKE